MRSTRALLSSRLAFARGFDALVLKKSPAIKTRGAKDHAPTASDLGEDSGVCSFRRNAPTQKA